MIEITRARSQAIVAELAFRQNRGMIRRDEVTCTGARPFKWEVILPSNQIFSHPIQSGWHREAGGITIGRAHNNILYPQQYVEDVRRIESLQREEDTGNGAPTPNEMRLLIAYVLIIRETMKP